MQLPAVDLVADAEHVSIRMTDVHLPDAPALIGGWMRDLQLFGEAPLMGRRRTRHDHPPVRA